MYNIDKKNFVCSRTDEYKVSSLKFEFAYRGKNYFEEAHMNSFAVYKVVIMLLQR